MLLQLRMSPGFQDPSESNGAVRNVEGPRGKDVEAGARRGRTSDCGVMLVDLRGNICANQQPADPACPPCLLETVTKNNAFLQIFKKHFECAESQLLLLSVEELKEYFRFPLRLECVSK